MKTKVDIEKLSPMMKQYMAIKSEYQDAIVFTRLGDFYEMFFDDALICARELELALTGKDCGLEERAPMCGVPYHASEAYLQKLVEKGYKVVVYEQVEDPKLAKGLVKRAVTRIVTPGTLTDLDASNTSNNFLIAIFIDKNSWGLSYIDITTGEFKTTQSMNSQNDLRPLLDLLVKVSPREIIINRNLDNKQFKNYLDMNNVYYSLYTPKNTDIGKSFKYIQEKTKIDDLIEMRSRLFSIMSSTMLLEYIYRYQEDKLTHISSLSYFNSESFMKIDASTRQNLEIHKNNNDQSKKNSLFEVLDLSNTPMGSRRINNWLEFPLLDLNLINKRLDMVTALYSDNKLHDRLERYLDNIYDLERILSKISFNRANAKDLLNLKHSIEFLPKIKKLLLNAEDDRLREFSLSIDPLDDIFKLLSDAIREDAPNSITEGNLIKEGYSKELDKLKYDSINAKKELIVYENELREETGVKSLKVDYNKNTGYYIELTKLNAKSAPDTFIRRQTLKNSERYVTEHLNHLSDRILGSQDDSMDLEYKIFNGIRIFISENATRIKNTTDAIADLDAYCAFSSAAIKYRFVRPTFNDKNIIELKASRHPIIEKNIGRQTFIPNDLSIGQDDNLIQIITGPNMAGKSTYMRQVALIILMAQIGSFVPCDKADLCISSSIFTRIGASDNLAKGDSTFMVEMKEMANIIENADRDSFIILDEVGRGTSTNDGLSIASSIVEYLSENMKAKTLFATHYHELVEMANYHDNVKNMKLDILEENGELVFLRKISPGSADRSYGIEVAKLSGLPLDIIFRASQILQEIDKETIDFSETLEGSKNSQEDFKANDALLLVSELRDLDIDNMSAKGAYDYLYELYERAKKIL